jgi:hypothetical protein
MEELIQTYIPSTVKTCIDVGIPFGVYDHTWTRAFPNYATIELFRKEYGTTCFRIKGGTGLGATFIGRGQTTCNMIGEVVTRVALPALFVLNGDRTLESTVSDEICKMYGDIVDGFAPSTLQDELNCVPSGSYILILNHMSSSYTLPNNAQPIYSSETAVILYLPPPEPVPVEVPPPEPVVEAPPPEPVVEAPPPEPVVEVAPPREIGFEVPPPDIGFEVPPPESL